MLPPPGEHRHNYSTIYCSKCGERHVIADPCGNRFCRICGAPARNRARAKMDSVIAAVKPERGYKWRHVVLTIPNGNDPGQLARGIVKSFRKLRQTAWWTNLVQGGFFVVELTHRASGWHVHLHVLVLARYMHAPSLSNQWRRVSVGYITQVKLAPPGTLSRYLTAYLTKAELSLPDQFVASRALKNFRLFNAFGSIKSKALSIKVPKLTCGSCGSTTWVHERSRAAIECIKLIGFHYVTHT